MYRDVFVSVKCTDFELDAVFVQGQPGSPGMPGPSGKPGKSGENGVPVSKYSLDHTQTLRSHGML